MSHFLYYSLIRIIILVKVFTILYSCLQPIILENHLWLFGCIWICNFGAQRGNLVVRGSSPSSVVKHFSILSVLSSATFTPFLTQTPRPTDMPPKVPTGYAPELILYEKCYKRALFTVLKLAFFAIELPPKTTRPRAQGNSRSARP